MKKETIRIMIFMMLCAVGGILIGLNAPRLSDGANAVLFVLGIVLISMTITAEGLFQTVWKRHE